MKIFDCTTFYNENLMLEVRFNVLNEFVDKFVITEAKYSHSGEKKKLNFDFNKFKEFKKKIIYLVVDKEPDSLIYEKNEKKEMLEKDKDMRGNSIKRIAHQRDNLLLGLEEASDEDYIFYSDNDEIPNLEAFNFRENKNKIIIFKQKLFYYKFNLHCDRIDWYGTKGCKKKFLKSFSWLREIKTKKYPFFRFDTFFSNNKYIDLKIVENGGWHFSQLMLPKDIEIKLQNSEHHDEYKLAKQNLPNVEDLIKRKVITYDHKAKTSDYKFANEFKLKTLSLDFMPLFLKNNVNKYSEWFDFEK
tara:strand:- start:499 stop:1401 length:903 start_codon:yes stop_codon:yes gene_type:complete